MFRAAKRSKMYANRDFSFVLLVKDATRPNCIAFCYHGGYGWQFCYKNYKKVTKKHPKNRGQGAKKAPKSIGNHDFSFVLLVKAATRPNCIAFCYHGGYGLQFCYKKRQKVTKRHPKNRGQGAKKAPKREPETEKKSKKTIRGVSF